MPLSLSLSWRCTSALALTLLVAACSSGPSVRQGGASYGSRTTGPEHSAGQEEIPIEAMSLVGVPYRWGGNTPDSGFDCSGLVHYVVLRAAGVNLPRTTADMSSVGMSLDRNELASGDLIFFNTTGRAHSHVGIYVGQGQFVHAPNSGGTVRLENINIPYWSRRIDGIRRVAANRAPAGDTTYVNRSAPATVAQAPAAMPLPAVPMSTAPNRPLTTAMPSPVAPDPAAILQGSPTRAANTATQDDDPIARFANGSL